MLFVQHARGYMSGFALNLATNRDLAEKTDVLKEGAQSLKDLCLPENPYHMPHPEKSEVPVRMHIDKTGSLPTTPGKTPPPPPPSAPELTLNVPKQDASQGVVPALTTNLGIPALTEKDLTAIKDIAAALYDISICNGKPCKYLHTVVEEGRKTIPTLAKRVHVLAASIAEKELKSMGSDQGLLTERIKLLEPEGTVPLIRSHEAQKQYFLDRMTDRLQTQISEELDTQFTKLHYSEGLQKYVRNMYQSHPKEGEELLFRIYGLDPEIVAAQLHSMFTLPDKLRQQESWDINENEAKAVRKTCRAGTDLYCVCVRLGKHREVEQVFRKKYNSDLFEYAAPCCKVSDDELGELFEAKFGIPGRFALLQATGCGSAFSLPKKCLLPAIKEGLGSAGVCAMEDVYDRYFQAVNKLNFNDEIRKLVTGKERTEMLSLLKDARQERNRALAATYGALPEKDLEEIAQAITAAKPIALLSYQTGQSVPTAIAVAAEKNPVLRKLIPYIQNRGENGEDIRATLEALEVAVAGLKDSVKLFSKECNDLLATDPQAKGFEAALMKKRKETTELLDKTLKKAAGIEL